MIGPGPAATRRLLLLAFASLACAAGQQPIAFLNANVVPMDSERVLERYTVVVREGRIAGCGPADSVAVPEDAARLDAEGLYLMPALADMHTHLVNSPDWPNDLFLFLANGVTTVRDMWGSAAFLRWREAITAGAVPGPRLVLASTGMDGPTGRFAALTAPITTPEQARRTVAQHKSAGYDFIKVYSDLTPDVYAAIMAEAAAQGIRVVGHVPTRVGLLEVLAARQYSIEHLMGIGELASSTGALTTGELDVGKVEALAGAICDAGAWMTATLTVGSISLDQVPALERRPEMRYVSPAMKRWFQDPTNRAPNQDLSRQQANRKRILMTLHAAGARLMLGVDSGFRYVLPGYSIHDELRHTVEAGLTPYQALRLATADAAEFLSQQDEAGTVEAGKRADLLLLQANPLQDVRHLAARAGVMVRGHWLSEPQIQDRLDQIARSYGNF